jgi:hypothetical protein
MYSSAFCSVRFKYNLNSHNLSLDTVYQRVLSAVWSVGTLVGPVGGTVSSVLWVAPRWLRVILWLRLCSL